MIGLVAWTGRNTALDQTQNQVQTNNNADPAENLGNSNINVADTLTNESLVTTDTFALLVSAETTIIGEITTYTFAENNILNVMPQAMQSAVLNETPVKERTAITIGETPAERLTLSSAKDGSDVMVVQAVIGETLYDFRGNEDFLSNLSNYIVFTSN